MKNKFLIIDGHNLLFQMFFGMPRKIFGKGGIEIQGIIGFVGAVNRLIDMVKPTHIAVLFDSETHNPRCELLSEYKQNRPDYSLLPECENPFFILPCVYSALDVMDIKHTEIKDAETDDVIASYALTSSEDTDVVISSFDSDYFQLISDRVRILRYRGAASVICDSDYIKQKFDISPSLYADFKSLVGDFSDNIRGIDGIGPKTASKIINKYGGIDAIIKNIDSIYEERYRCKLSEASEILKRNIKLIKLDAHAPLPFEFDDLCFSENRIKTMDVIRILGL